VDWNHLKISETSDTFPTRASLRRIDQEGCVFALFPLEASLRDAWDDYIRSKKKWRDASHLRGIDGSEIASAEHQISTVHLLHACFSCIACSSERFHGAWPPLDSCALTKTVRGVAAQQSQTNPKRSSLYCLLSLLHFAPGVLQLLGCNFQILSPQPAVS